MLFLRRKRQHQLEVAEAKGASFWTSELSQEARSRLWYAFNDLHQAIPQVSAIADSMGSIPSFADQVRYRVVSELGMPSIADQYRASDDIQGGILNGSTEVVLSTLEATLAVGNDLLTSTHGHHRNVGKLYRWLQVSSL